MIEGTAPGGQAGTSSKIENYLGFPTGISGEALAGRAQVQAQKFGAKLAIARTCHSCRRHAGARPLSSRLREGQRVSARAVIVASGARYRKLDVPDYARFEGQGIHYAATAMEASLCAGEEVLVVGGGNSAGQAAMFLSRTVRHLHILVRSGGLAETMSDYLVQRIHSSAQITLHTQSRVTGLEGDTYLRHVSWTNLASGKTQRHPIGNMFVMIGAEPNTDWLEGCLALDDRGFVRTGPDAACGRDLQLYALTRQTRHLCDWRCAFGLGEARRFGRGRGIGRGVGGPPVPASGRMTRLTRARHSDSGRECGG